MRVRDRSLMWLTIWVLPALALLLGLGTWQWQRKLWKEELIATIAARREAPPAGPELLRDARCQGPGAGGPVAACEYVRVRLEGRFDHRQERHVFTPSPPPSSAVRGPGYLVFTPLRTTAVPLTVWVNRGYVPEEAKEPGARAAGQIEGETAVEGFVRSREQRRYFDAANNPRRNIWFVRDPLELSAAGGGLASPARGAPPANVVTDFYIDQSAPVPPGGLPLPLEGRYRLSNRHLEYALTWWGLALTLVGVYAAFAVGRLRTALRSPA